MTYNYLFIINLNSGRGKAKQYFKKLKKYISEKNIDCEIICTSTVLEFDNLIKELSNDSRKIIIIGGDGSVFSLINSINDRNAVYGIIPAGSGNDFSIHTLNMYRNFIDNLNYIFNNPSITEVNWGNIEITTASKIFIRSQFLNSIGIGFDAKVAAVAQKIPIISGLPLYLTSTFYNLLTYKSVDCEITIDDNPFDRKVFMFSVGNGKTAGGGFKLTPLASYNDSALDFLIVQDVNRLTVLKILPLAIIGKHITNKNVLYKIGKGASLKFSKPVVVHGDGEIITKDAIEIKIQLEDSNLKFINRQ